MCGISINRGKPELHELTKHRGIKSKTVIHNDYSVCHHWLPIQTEGDEEFQMPIKLEDGSLFLFNGEIFGYDKVTYGNDINYLIMRFIQHEYEPISFFESLGDLDGFWSIVIMDGRSNVWFCTDPLGKKILYFEAYNRSICSEIRGLDLKGYNIYDPYMALIAQSGFMPSEYIPLARGRQFVRRTLPGHIYCNFNYTGTQVQIPDTQLVATIEDLMAQSVVRRLAGHKDIACFISGGLDSSIIALHIEKYRQGLMLRAFCSEPLRVNYYYTNNGDDEQYVERLSDYLNISPIKVNTTEDLPSSQVKHILDVNELPTDLGSMIPQYNLFASVKETVVITGDGADELFGGYKRNEYYNSFSQDVNELSMYHLPRIDKMSMHFTKEARQPFLGLGLQRLVEHSGPYRGKKILKDYYSKHLPSDIVMRPKLPLKSKAVKEDRYYRYKLIKLYYELFEEKQSAYNS